MTGYNDAQLRRMVELAADWIVADWQGTHERFLERRLQVGVQGTGLLACNVRQLVDSWEVVQASNFLRTAVVHPGCHPDAPAAMLVALEAELTRREEDSREDQG